MEKCNYEYRRTRAIEDYIKSKRRRKDALKLIERIMFIMSNAPNTYKMNQNTRSLEDILGDRYIELKEDEQDEIYRVFSEEVELGKLGIFHEEGQNNEQEKKRFFMKISLKERFLGEEDLKEIKLENLVNKIKNHKIQINKVDNVLISYIHQFYSVGDEFTLEDVFGKYWIQIDEIPRIQIGSDFAISAHSGTIGIKALKTSGVNIVKEGGKNKYIVTYIV